MSLRSSRKGDRTPPGPPHQVSRPAERKARVSNAADAGEARSQVMVFSQVFVMAPVRSHDAELVFDVTQATTSGSATGASSGVVGLPSRTAEASRGAFNDGASGSTGSPGVGTGLQGPSTPRRVGSCRVSLRELADQREHDIPLTVLKKVSEGCRVPCSPASRWGHRLAPFLELDRLGRSLLPVLLSSAPAIFPPHGVIPGISCVTRWPLGR